MTLMSTPAAILKAQRLIWTEARRCIAAHCIRFYLTTEPDQYRVEWTSLRDGMAWQSLVKRVTLSEREFREWEKWLEDREQGAVRL